MIEFGKPLDVPRKLTGAGHGGSKEISSEELARQVQGNMALEGLAAGHSHPELVAAIETMKNSKAAAPTAVPPLSEASLPAIPGKKSAAA